MEITEHEGVRTVTFDRSDALNAFTTETADDQHDQTSDLREPRPRLEAALNYENVAQSQAMGTDEHREGVSAFLEEGEPEFQS